nr:NADH-quinone oxidoreductase subunit C [Neorickettsia helminthoeca]
MDKLIDESDPAVLGICSDSLMEVLGYVSSLGFTLLVDVFGVDYPEREKRIELIYILLDMKQNRRCHVKLAVDPALEKVPTCCGIFRAADWFEREVYDMYGVIFSDHPRLERILTDYGFEGFPMLKDFPLTGYKEVRYDLETKKVVYEDVNLPQEYRSFDFLTPWEGTKYVDEMSGEKKD